ncbi:MAG: T9SS type A sorting domain-containing protein [Psychroserpens sp.]|nr:T9SS type A sorting domain-containing protein [Psychroserpens sp.]
MKKMLFIICILSFKTAVFSQTVYIVNTTVDLPDSNLNDSVCADANGNCTLRAAIENANKTNNKDSIVFDISGTSPFTININTLLPPIQQSIIIDGKTQPGYLDAPIIEINGSNLANGNNGLQLIGNASGSEIYGLSIGGFRELDVDPFNFGFGIFANTGNHTFQSNYIGIKPDGTTINSNTGGGLVLFNSGNNQIGGIQAGLGNLVSGNDGGGITISGSSTNSNASNNLIQGNFIGTDVSGTLNRGNRFNVQFINAPNNILGGTTAEARNIISGARANDDDSIGTGIVITGEESFGNSVLGNFIGTDITGNQSIPNVRGGILILFGAHDNTIGSGNTNGGNVISGNGQYGIYLQGGATTSIVESNTIIGNYVGVNAIGDMALPNEVGIMMLTGQNNNNIIGGTTQNSKNVISGNLVTGLAILSGVNNQILGNYIGTNATGTDAIPNPTGIEIADANNSIGGIVEGSRNIISGNGTGIRISNSGSNGTEVKGNYIGLNASGEVSISNDKGIWLQSSSTGCEIGGISAQERNIISGNSDIGLDISGTSHSVKNNYIGLNPEGTSVIGNGNVGIKLFGSLMDTKISENTISGNGTGTQPRNVYFLSANSAEFFGNNVGTLPDGNTGVLNLRSGLYMLNSINNIIGGETADKGNIIGSHNNFGIEIADGSNDNIIRNNKIGVGLDGVTELGNSLAGILIYGNNTGNLIAENTIANNGNGVELAEIIGTPTQVTITENSIYDNINEGIDLEGASNNNDPDDPDTGVNNLQNFPEIDAINNLGGSEIEITYAVPSSITNSEYPLLVEFFGSVSGQGKFFIGSDVYLTPGTKIIALNLPNNFDPEDYDGIVGTSTDANGNTSEFGLAAGFTLSNSTSAYLSFNVFPNPANNILYINSNISRSFQIEILNTLGQTILSQNYNNSSITIDLSFFSKGLYFLKINSEDDKLQTIKFVKY